MTLDVQRPGVKETMKVKVVRDEIPIETVYSSVKNVNNKKLVTWKLRHSLSQRETNLRNS